MSEGSLEEEEEEEAVCTQGAVTIVTVLLWLEVSMDSLGTEEPADDRLCEMETIPELTLWVALA